MQIHSEKIKIFRPSWLAFGTALAICLGWPLGSVAGATPAKPNIIFILCDDLGYNDLGCYAYPSKDQPGPPPAVCPIGYTNYTYLPGPNWACDTNRPNRTITPNIDQLAAEGMKLSSFYVAPVCSPARAELMTGCYPYRVGVNTVFSSTDTHGLHTSEISVAKVLKTLGYATGVTGKWHLGTQRQFLPSHQGFDEFFGVPYSVDMSPLNLYQGDNIIEFIGNGTNIAQLTQRYTAWALDFIERNRNGPFFLYFPHSMVHVPVYASANFKGASGRTPYYDAVMEIDWSVGQILSKLKELNLDTNTLVMFTSDNGPWNSRKSPNNNERSVGSAYPLRESKHFTGDGGVRVPCIAR